MKHYKWLRTIIVFLIYFIGFSGASVQASSYNDSLNALVSSLVSGTRNKKVHTIAVVNFIETTSKQRYMLSDLLEDDLTTKIIQTNRFQVIVKSRIDEVLGELKFCYEGFVDPEKRKQFGKLAQATRS